MGEEVERSFYWILFVLNFLRCFIRLLFVWCWVICYVCIKVWGQSRRNENNFKLFVLLVLAVFSLIFYVLAWNASWCRKERHCRFRIWCMKTTPPYWESVTVLNPMIFSCLFTGTSRNIHGHKYTPSYYKHLPTLLSSTHVNWPKCYTCYVIHCYTHMLHLTRYLGGKITVNQNISAQCVFSIYILIFNYFFNYFYFNIKVMYYILYTYS